MQMKMEKEETYGERINLFFSEGIGFKVTHGHSMERFVR
jgi:hypothetical protein